ncbi:MAG TPA: hypothetical protein VNE63_00460 [Candidatus Acidoferrales bacterium]|nr:hypothetical protein [Candidatus Acidoferrales bacterium]
MTKRALCRALRAPILCAILLLACAALSEPTAAAGGPVTVRYAEGLTHGFFVVRTQDGRQIADGELRQVAHGDRVINRITFHFQDGSIEDETTVFSEHGVFRLLSDHFLQKGPAFKGSVETSIDTATGRVVVHYTDNGKQKVITERLDLPSDLSNGLLFTLLKNVQPTTPKTTVSYLGFTPKPIIVQLLITPRDKQAFTTGKSKHTAIDFDVKTEIGGVTGIVTHLLGKLPADTHVWVLADEAPAFVGMEGPFYSGGPIWQVDLVSPIRRGPVEAASPASTK